MEKITTRRNIIKTIEEEVEMDVFVSKDGTVFDTENECTRHEDELDFLTYFNDKYKLREIDIEEYGLNFGHPSFCHLVYIKKINDEVINDFMRFYELKDHPDDIIKLKDGWSFVAIVSDVNLWIFDKSDRLFIIENLETMINNKRKELNLLTKLRPKQVSKNKQRKNESRRNIKRM